ncbi:MAG TPA: HAMP domain-containing sensor histidine kinase [Acidimicrobiia bacterium]|nr:HAMP domain-containing sensor histidine kinase [Acidimicrobiia bacterium]
MRQRLVLSTVGVALGALLVLGLPVVFFVDRLARAEATAIVRRQAEGIATGLANEIAAGRVVTAEVLAAAVPPGDHLVLRTEGGTVVSAGEIRARGVVAVDVSAVGGITLRLETSDEFVRAKVRQAWLALGGLGALGLAVAAGLAGLQARRLAGPLDDLAQAAERLGAGDFSATAPRSGLEEVDTIAAALDSSAARIANLVQAEREFSANASHQLRSALTSLRLRLESLAAADDPTVAGEAARALEQAERLSDTVAELLRLARTGRADDAQSFDLAVLASAHLRDLAPRFEVERRAAALVAPRPVRVRAAAGAVGQALDVLLDNALRHGAGPIRVVVESAGDHGHLTVEDQGPGIDPEAGARLFERRGAGDGGHGIGLALARTLVQADGGRLDLVRAIPASFRITLPLATSSTQCSAPSQAG